MKAIYKYENKINHKVYIGQTCQKPEKRWDYGCGYKRHNLHFYNAIQKYGWDNFEHIILEDCLSLEQANEREQYWIKYYNSNQQEKGYNLTAGGDGSPFRCTFHGCRTGRTGGTSVREVQGVRKGVAAVG